ncbi:MAG: DnaJ domain-containing protein [Phycisphaerales bacterium JB052]
MSTKQPNQRNSPSNENDTVSMRREVRLHTDDLSCSVGRVADITGSGMRLIFPKGNPPQIGEVQTYIFNDGRDSLEVTGSVKWVRKGSAFSRQAEAGIEFVKLDQSVRDSMIRLAVHGKINEKNSGYVRIEQTDLYKLLGVTRYATPEQLDEAFNTECQRWGGDDPTLPQAAQKLDEICKAYAVLSDPDKRANYDKRFADQHDRAA